MKFFLPIALLAAAGGVYGAQSSATATAASPQSSSCDAESIVQNCLKSETKKKTDCDSKDYDCLCAAAQAIRTCYNNCPGDAGTAGAQSDVDSYCAQKSIQDKTKKPATKTKAAAGHKKTADATTTADVTGTMIASDPTASSDSGAAEMVRNTGGVLAAVAGVIAALL